MGRRLSGSKSMPLQELSNLLVFPRLKDSAQLKKFDNYVLIYLNKISINDVIHPSQAVFLSLCNGSISTKELKYLMGEIYRLSPEDSAKIVDEYLKRSTPFLDILDGPEESSNPRYDAMHFIYSIDDAALEEQRHQPLQVPIGINLNLSFRCNFRCRYCYQNASSQDGRSLDLVTCKRLIHEAADWGMAHVGLTGGEPTLFDGWISLLEEILKLGLNPIITTNGFIIGRKPEIAKQLKEIGLKEMTVSLDASTPELHHFITQTSNTFSEVIGAINALVDSGIRVVVKSVLTKYNMNNIEDLIDLVVDLGVSEIGISLCEAGSMGSGANEIAQLTSEEMLMIRCRIEAKQKNYQGICNIHPPRDAPLLWNNYGWYPCGGLYMGMIIHPSGNVTICDKLGDNTPFVYGNIYEKSLKEIWGGEEFRRLRDRTVNPHLIDVKCTQCSKLNDCRTGCFVDSFQACGNYFGKHPLCKGPFKHN